MRVMQVMAGARNGGAEMFFERLTGALHPADIEQKVVIRKDRDRATRLAQSGLEVSELPFGGRLDIYTPLALRCIAGHFKPDVVLTWMNRASRMMPATGGIHVARLGGFYDLKSYKACDHLVGNTRGIVDYLLAQGWPADRAHYLPNFVTVDDAQPVARKSLSTPDDAPVLLSMGRLHTNKAFDVLIEAMGQIRGAYLWLAGEGPERLALETLAYNRGVDDRVRFLGWRRDISALLAACDVYVCPSRHEPLGNAVIEGWAAGKPVVAAASQGPSELIADGVNGLLVPVDDADELAGTVNEVLSDGARAAGLGAAGAESYRQAFTKEVVVARYLDFFRRVSETG